jgi:ABC-type transport system involved in cytochrome c biogenesis permease subunit
MLEPVLDTKFWLSTHVICVTLGYATTFVAGLLGITYVVLGVFTPLLGQSVSTLAEGTSAGGIAGAGIGAQLRRGGNAPVGKLLADMIYGVVCFSILFSFFGTVLGGLWADDSWGRFWGWDTKENGALIIVIWNALVLHARWDGMVKDRGLAVLAIGGNIAVSWSMFGVNQLQAGLHSYGFTEGVWPALIGFWVSQLIMIAVGTLPKRIWRSNCVSAV